MVRAGGRADSRWRSARAESPRWTTCASRAAGGIAARALLPGLIRTPGRAPRPGTWIREDRRRVVAWIRRPAVAAHERGSVAGTVGNDRVGLSSHPVGLRAGLQSAVE